MSETQRDWIYLLPDGRTAENMKDGCEMMRESTGHAFSAEAYRSLVKKDIIKKIDRVTHCIYTKRDANRKETISTR